MQACCRCTIRLIGKSIQFVSHIPTHVLTCTVTQKQCRGSQFPSTAQPCTVASITSFPDALDHVSISSLQSSYTSKPNLTAQHNSTLPPQSPPSQSGICSNHSMQNVESERETHITATWPCDCHEPHHTHIHTHTCVRRTPPDLPFCVP